jgi:myo-inositol-1(or 4)-monophosphatase
VKYENPGMEEIKEFAFETIRNAGTEALAYYGKGNPRVKFDEDVITQAEIRIQKVFKEQLAERFPEHQLFQHNHVDKAYTHEQKRYLWIFDPLDGVSNFLAGIPVWGMSLAVLDNYWPVLGVFYMPSTGDMFHASVNDKSYWGEQVIHTSFQEAVNDESMLLIYSRFHQKHRTHFPGKVRNLGCTAAHLCYVAMGSAEAAFITNESYQDLAAVRVIIEAAGGKMYKMDGSEFFLSDYKEGEGSDEHLLVASPQNVTSILETIEHLS